MPAPQVKNGATQATVAGGADNMGTMAARVLVEVCVESVEGAVAAETGGAARIELNCALALDGLTPTPGLLTETRRAIRIPLISMARPRPGGFCYSDSEFRVLRRDTDFALEQGADGVALGVLTSRRRVDTRRCRAILRRLAGNSTQLVFHRAFDQVRAPLDALEQLIDLGFRRVMTSGCRPTAVAGIPMIRRLIENAAGRIEILPAGGIRSANVRQIIRGTGCDQVHSSLRDARGRINARSLAGLLRSITH